MKEDGKRRKKEKKREKRRKRKKTKERREETKETKSNASSSRKCVLPFNFFENPAAVSRKRVPTESTKERS